MIEYKVVPQHNDPDLIDFINYVFSANSIPHDFIKLIPQVYEPQAKPDVVHLSAQEGGRIRAVVSVYMYTLRHGELSLKVGFIGNVSVHPYHRGKGYMIKLMEMARQTMLDHGCDISMLTGQRQRYEHFGYYEGCMQAGMRVDATNLRHVLGRDYVSPLEVTADFDMDEVYTIYNQQTVSGRSKECFEISSRGWGCQLLAVKEEGQTIGYVIAGEKKDSWWESALPEGKYLSALAAFMKKFGVGSVSLAKPLYDRIAIEEVAPVAGSCQLSWSAMIQALNWENVLRWSLTVQKAGDGEAQIGPYQVSVQEGVVTVQKTGDAPMPEPNMMFSLFPTSEQEKYPRGWFPLQLWVSHTDHF